MKAVRVSWGRRGSSVQAWSAIVGVSSRCAAISAAGSSRQEACAASLGWRSGGDGGLGRVARLEAQAVLGSRPELRYGEPMLRRPVALVTSQAVAWVALVQASHEAIAGRLGHDRGGRNGRARRVSVDDLLVLRRARAERIAVDGNEAPPAGVPQILSRSQE
jgi:hypothetical protein